MFLVVESKKELKVGKMGELTKNLSRYEFECRCSNSCGFDTVDFMLIKMIQDGADYFETKYGRIIVDIRGGNRCKEHNEFVQKKYVPNYVPYSSKSVHMEGKAADVKYFYFKDKAKTQISPEEVHSYFTKLYPTSKGLGLYHNRNHIDSRRNKARWVA